MNNKRVLLLVVAVSLILAGCTAPTPAPTATTEPSASAPTAAPTATTELPTETVTATATSAPTATATEAAAPTETAQPAMTTEEAALAADLLAAAPADAYAGIWVMPLPSPDSSRPLWVAYSYGMRNYDLDPAVLHFVAVYTRQNDAWQEIDRLSLDAPALHGTAAGDVISSDYVGQGDVQVVALGDDTTGQWIQVSGGVGAHSGVYQLLRFDGTKLSMEYAAMSSSPGFGRVADINADGQNEVVLDTSDPYVFCYACGLRHVSFEVWRWDAEAGALEQVALEPLAGAAAEGVGTPLNQAVTWAQAGLWKDALDQVDSLTTDAVTAGELAALDAETRAVVDWDTAIIRLTSDAMQAEFDGGYPLLAYVFYGDYASAVDMLREQTPENIYTAASPLIIGTTAEGWTSELAQNLVTSTQSALAAEPDLAAAYLLKSWGEYLADPASTEARADAAKAAELAPDDSFYAACAAYVQTAPTTTGYVPAQEYLVSGLQSAVESTLGISATVSVAAFTDPIEGVSGSGREITVTGTGVDFESFSAVAATLRQILIDQGWTEDSQYQADGPTGTAFGVRQDNALALVSVSWEPSPDANCPKDEPISNCQLTPEQQLYTITLNLATR